MITDEHFDIEEISKDERFRNVRNEELDVAEIRKYFRNGIVPKSPEIFEDSLIDEVDEDIKTLLDLAVTRISLNQSIKEIVKYIKILEIEKDLKQQGYTKYEQESKYKDGNPYILSVKEKLKDENKTLDLSGVNIEDIKHTDVNIENIKHTDVNNTLDLSGVNIGNIKYNEDKYSDSPEVANSDLNLTELNIIKEYFKDRKIPKSSQNIDEYLVDPSISSIIKDLLGVIVARLNRGQSIRKFFTWLEQETKEPFLEDIIKSVDKSAHERQVKEFGEQHPDLFERFKPINLNNNDNEKVDKIYPEVENTTKEISSKVQFPSELERRNTSRDVTGRNIYDILTYEEKVNFLILNPEYTLDNLPKEFFNINELIRLEKEYPDLAKHRHEGEMVYPYNYLDQNSEEQPSEEIRDKELMFKLFPHNPDTLKYVDEDLKKIHSVEDLKKMYSVGDVEENIIPGKIK